MPEPGVGSTTLGIWDELPDPAGHFGIPFFGVLSSLRTEWTFPALMALGK